MTQDRSYTACARLREERTRALRAQRLALVTLALRQLARLGLFGLAWFFVGFAFCYMLITTGVIQP